MDLNFNLHKKQLEVFKSKARFKIVAAGRRAGKSYLSAVTLLIEALKEYNRFGIPLKGKEVWYVAPTYQQARDIIWGLLKDMGQEVIEQVYENTSTMRLINGRTIKLKGSDRPDTLRGVSLAYVRRRTDDATSQHHSLIKYTPSGGVKVYGLKFQLT